MEWLAAIGRAAAAASVLAAAALGGPAAALADDPAPESRCRWDGTAPFCDGGCRAGEDQRGSAPNAQFARRLWEPEAASFGKACATGNKALCCTYSCPGGYQLVLGTLSSPRRCVKNSGVPVQPQVITIPPAPAVPLNKGVVVKPGPAGPLMGTRPVAGNTTTSAPPAMATVTVLLNVDVYDQPGGGGKKLGILTAGTAGVSLVEPCRADHWCHVKGNVPGGTGWVWSGPGYQSLQT